MLPVPYPRQDEAIPQGPCTQKSQDEWCRERRGESRVEKLDNTICLLGRSDPSPRAPRPRPGTSTRNSPSLGK